MLSIFVVYNVLYKLFILSAMEKNTCTIATRPISLVGVLLSPQFVSVPPLCLSISFSDTEIVEEIPVNVQCIISRVLPSTNVSAFWTKQSGNTEAGTASIEQNQDGTFKLTFKTSLNFTRQDNYEDLICHIVWKGTENYTTEPEHLFVQCEYTVCLSGY